MRRLLMKIETGLFKLVHWPICRAYAQYIIKDKPADSVMRFLCSFQFYRVYKFWPDFVNPTRFSEKLWNRMLYERDPLFTLITDKLRVRNYVAAKIGIDHLIPFLWHGEKSEEISFDDLPTKFVIKTNHGCGYNIIVKDRKSLDQEKTKRQLKIWLEENFAQDKYLGIVWGYRNIKPSIIIEEFIEDNGKVPVDYKFYCFSGKVEIVTLHLDRFGENKTKAFNRNFEPLRFRKEFRQWDGECQRPPNFEIMVNLSESLAEDFDFIRVDLYSVGNKIYFGELTPYPGGVSLLRGFDVLAMDHFLGKKWEKDKS